MDVAPQTVSWSCIDDGTGRDLYYVSSDGTKSRKKPENFNVEYFENGRRRYFFRGLCIRCKKREYPSCISSGDGEFVFAFSQCFDCLLLITQISHFDGNTILACNSDSPLVTFINTRDLVLDDKRNYKITERANYARFLVLTDAKYRRNQSRIHLILQTKTQYNISVGEHASWGFDNRHFDEYFGALNSTRRPHGYGIMLYSDGSVYIGEWLNGKRETNQGGRLIRPNGAEYEGSWIDDCKHGKGKQFYPDGAVYEGEFARGVEHGNGMLTYPDGRIFAGRFRYGKRDGPGTSYNADKKAEIKGNFKDTQVYYSDEPPPPIVETRETDSGLMQAESLLELSTAKLANAVCADPSLTIAQNVSTRLYTHLKPLVTMMTVLTGSPNGTEDFKKAALEFAFKKLEVINLSGVRMKSSDLAVFLSLEGRSGRLKSLFLTSAKLEGESINLLAKHLSRSLWPSLTSLDLSRNAIQLDRVASLISALRTPSSLSSISLSCCGLKDDSAHEFAKMLGWNIELTSLDLSFNSLNATGADILAQALPSNRTLLNLNLRANGIGTIGGLYLAKALKGNDTLRALCLVDNDVGEEIISSVSARLKGRTREVLESLKIKELKP